MEVSKQKIVPKENSYYNYFTECMILVCIILVKSNDVYKAVMMALIYIFIMINLDKQQSYISSSVRNYLGFCFVQFLTSNT